MNSNMGKTHKSEIEFHDRKSEKKINKKSFYNQGALQSVYNKMLDIAGDLKDKQVLDYGCGNGWTSIQYARRGALVTGLDISLGAINKAKQLARDRNFHDRISFVQGNCEHLPFKEKFDMILGVAILHHIDLEHSIKGIEKSLKKGGKCIFMEPLDHNPFINFFRLLTPNRRTEDEKPLSIDMIKSFEKTFSKVNIYGYHLFALLAYSFFVLKAYKLFRFSLKYLTMVDNTIFKVFPGLQKYCWGVIIEMKA